MSGNLLFFILFLIAVLIVLMLDLLVIGRKSHEVTIREAAIWSAIWISTALGFSLFLRFFGEMVHGISNQEELNQVIGHFYPYLSQDTADYSVKLETFRKAISINFISGYLIEKSLSVDNLFVMMAILKAFSVKKAAYKPVLFWGILGAFIMRFIFIFAGATIIYRFEWILYIFGAYLLYVGYKMYRDRNKDIRIEPRNHPMVKFLSRRFKVYQRYVGNRFFIRKDNLLYITPLFIVLIMIEISDLIFALDSIPAVFAVTRDPYIVFFSNVFAILGLRALFFLLVRVVDRFYLLKTGVAILLVFVGLKLIAHEWLVHIGYKPAYSLYVILGVLILSISLSVIIPPRTSARCRT